MAGSPPFSLSGSDLTKILKGLAIAAAGSALSYLAVNVIPQLDTTHYAWLIPVLSALVNAGMKYLKDTTTS